MSSFSYPTVIFAPLKRSVAIMSLTGVIMLGSPLVPAFAQSEAQSSSPQSTAPLAPAPLAPARQAPAHRASAAQREQTVEQRITQLHAELKITPGEEADWKAVGQTMRDNAATMQKLAAEKSAQKGMTAVEDLQTYAEFAQTHVEGLKNLIGSFQTLYNEMPEQQQKLADQVFQRSRRG